MKSPPPKAEKREVRATIDGVARLARVSKATVSRFLNHRTTRLTPEIALRVEQAVTQLAYTPSPMAQGLKRGRSRLIGLVVADLTNPFRWSLCAALKTQHSRLWVSGHAVQPEQCQRT